VLLGDGVALLGEAILYNLFVSFFVLIEVK
jgi:hypothetical protein